MSFDKTWANLSETVKECQKCSLCDTRNHTVFGEGDVNAKLFFVGEAPGKDEDLSGKPFVGRAGKLLTKMIIAMGLQREDVFIANILKCRPPDNRNPSSEEIEKCVPYLKRQISIIQPKILCTLGSFATKTLLEEETPISKLRGKVYSYEGVSLVPTFHPAYLLRNASMKAKAWQDLQLVMKLLDTR
ncbi:uracil-DNA glycosylase [PVC group bacterium (ex Bugula neritina AB1)]|nr:uracil-DNA glycosylase [PVC group bacterium (ex Bugula neritina AB1)]